MNNRKEILDGRPSGVSQEENKGSKFEGKEEDKIGKAASYLSATALRLMRSKNPDELLRAPRTFGAYIRSIMWANQIDRGEAARRSGLDRQVWSAVELGYVPIEELWKLIPQLAVGLGCEEQYLNDLLTETIEDAK